MKNGDNLWAIARARGTTVDELRAVNASSIGRGDVIYPGQELIIPSTPKRSAPGVPSGYRPSTPSYGNYTTATSSSRATAPAFSRAKLAETQGLGFVTVGAFFLALAAGIWLFKDDKYKDGAAGRGGFDERRTGTSAEMYDQAQGRDGWVDGDGNYAGVRSASAAGRLRSVQPGRLASVPGIVELATEPGDAAAQQRRESEHLVSGVERCETEDWATRGDGE